jgi:predicted site-specific integrase-resolvase
MVKVGNARISTVDQNEDRQIDSLTKLGCSTIFTDIANNKIRRNTTSFYRLVKQVNEIGAYGTGVVADLIRTTEIVDDLN